MKFTMTRQGGEKIACDCLVVGVYKDGGMSPGAEAVDQACGGAVKALLARDSSAGSIGKMSSLYPVPKVAAEKVLLLGLGEAGELASRDFVRALEHVASALTSGGIQKAAFSTAGIEVKEQDDCWVHRQLALRLEGATYRYLKTKPSAKAPQKPLRSVHIHAASMRRDIRKAVDTGRIIAEGQALTRSLGDLPPNLCTPEYLARQARVLARSDARFKIRVMGPTEIKKRRMRALLAVAQGSTLPPRLIVLEYRGAAKDRRAPVALVGKGVTFDTGGISIKPSHAMDEMKFDMSGAGSVLGTLATCAKLNLPQRVIGIIPAVENMPGGNATRPGDVVTTASGQTVEILNTDAEGRLILCDALHHARQYRPRLIIDIATLTGACVAALGHHASGAFCAQADLLHEIIEAGRAGFDRVWPLPLWDDYQSELDSNFADMANIGSRYAGATTAACFLSRFTGDIPWVHLDIAGTAWYSGKKKGATGRPVPLLAHFLIKDAEA